MKKFIARAAALLAAAVMTVSAAVSCSSSKDDTLELKDMPYGGEYRKVLPEEYDTPIGVDRDPRFVNEAECAKIADYFYAISERNPEYLEKALHPDFLKYTLESSGFASTQEFLDKEYDLIKEYIGTDYSFDFVLIDGMENANGKEFEVYDQHLESAMPGAKPKNKKCLMVNCTYVKKENNNGGTYSLKERLGDYVYLCVYTIDGEPYVIF